MRVFRPFVLIIAITVPALFHPACIESGDPAASGREQSAKALPDLSGLAWVADDLFLAVHDAKNPGENDRPRVSLLRLPASLDGVTSTPLQLEWPAPLGLSSDLESIARVPGTDSFLLVESGESINNGRQFRRAFLVELKGMRPVILASAELPDIIKNIEGSAVARLADRLIFICAERGDHRPDTKVYWSDLRLQPLSFGAFQTERFAPGSFRGRDKRPVSAIDIDAAGRIYIASAYDPGDDNGPFTSVIWRAGRIEAGPNNRPRLVFAARPEKLASLDGFKVESLAIRNGPGGAVELFAGTDDENYGGALRLIPLGR